jgi:hypothetical protein
MALVSRARLRSGHTDIGAEIHLLMSHCTQPLADWLEVASLHTQGLSNVVLLDPEDLVPTSEAQELAAGFFSTGASLEERLFEQFREQLRRSSKIAEHANYTRVREFVVRHPIATATQLSELTRELPSTLGLLISEQFYEPVPENWARDGLISCCVHCGNALSQQLGGLACRTHACAETLAAESGPIRKCDESLRLKRAVRQYWQEPGFDELRLYDELKQGGRPASLYPNSDRVDIAVGEVGMDMKAYVSPELLASRIARNLGGLADYRIKWLVIPDRLIRRVPAYLERLRAALGQSPVRAIPASAVPAELDHA